MQVLHVARYYGCDQLVALSERRLVLMLLRAEEQNAAHELVPTPHKLETAPHELTPAPHELAPTPHNLESAPHELASAPQELAPQLLAIALNEGLAQLVQAALDYVSAGLDVCGRRVCRRKGTASVPCMQRAGKGLTRVVELVPHWTMAPLICRGWVRGGGLDRVVD